MKRLLGGLFLLNLTAISLGLTSGEVSITDSEVLKQLGELRNFIDNKRDFTKESKGLKSVLVQYRSSVSKIDGIVPCNLSFNTDALHLSIAGYSVQADGTPITICINVEYEWVNYVGYQVKTAKLEATNSLKVKTIEQEEANYSFDFEWTSEDLANVGLTITNIYNKFEIINNVLYIITNVNYKNETGASVSFTQFVKDIELPEELGEKIYDYNGDNLLTNTNADITTDWGFTGIAGIVAVKERLVSFRHNGSNKMRIIVNMGTSSLADNAQDTLTFRTFLTLL